MHQKVNVLIHHDFSWLCGGVFSTYTRVVEKCVWFLAILWWSDELPYEAFDIFISTVMQQTEDQDDPADGLHILFSKTTLTSSMGQDIMPPSPAGHKGGKRLNIPKK